MQQPTKCGKTEAISARLAAPRFNGAQNVARRLMQGRA